MSTMETPPNAQPRTGTPAVSVIMPARNAAATLDEALDSLAAQTWTSWEVLVVDDGSTDGTRAIAEARAARDPRVRVLEGPRRGAGAARNAGLAAAAGEWILFFDSDDFIAPDLLARMIERAEQSGGEADAVHCGWVHTDPAGRPISSGRCWDEGPDLFPIFARYCAFTIHACLIRRRVLAAVGGFDESLVVCEDFDLWQRVARIGTRFVPLDAALAFYRLRPDTSWFDPDRFLDDALTVVRRGHAADPRLPSDLVPAAHRDGAPAAGLAGAEVEMTILAGAMTVAQGRDAPRLLDRLRGPAPFVDAAALANSVFVGLPLALCRPREDWPEIWPQVEGRLQALFDALEARTGAARLSARTQRRLEMRIAEGLAAQPAPEGVSRRFGATAVIHIEATHPIGDLSLDGAERAVIAVSNYGHAFGTVALPVFGGWIPAAVLADAIGGALAWPLLDSLLSSQVYPTLAVDQGPDGWRIARGGLPLASGLGADPRVGGRLHDHAGWAVFIQELTGLPDWSLDRLYDATAPQPAPLVAPSVPAAGMVTVEASMPLPEIVGSGRTDRGFVSVEVTLGGATALVMSLELRDGRITPARLRAALLDQGKMELARVAAREACVGWTGDPALSLRDRLRARAEEARARREAEAPSVRVLAGAIEPGRARAAVLPLAAAHRPLGVIGSRIEDGGGHGRRAVLPARAIGFPGEGLRPGQPALALGEGRPDLVVVLPELVGSAPSGAAGEGGAASLRHGGSDGEWSPVSGAHPSRGPLRGVRRLLKGGGMLAALSGRLRRAAGGPAGAGARRAMSSAGGAGSIPGGGVPRGPSGPVQTSRLPILMYHAVSDAGPDALARWRVTPAQLDAQLGHLRQAGYTPATLAEWRAARAAHRPLDGRRVIVTFDDGYTDFEAEALPILRRHGMPATLFVPAGHVGGSAEWDAWAGTPLPLMGWDALRRLRDAGITIGGHSWSHPMLNALNPGEMAEELWRSRVRIEAELGIEVDALAYPSGASDEYVEAVAAACGYRHGLTTVDAPSGLGERDLALSRVEVRGDMSLEQFIARLSE